VLNSVPRVDVESERDPAVRRVLERRTSRVVEDPGPLHDPIRLLTAVGAVTALVASALPWAVLEGSPRNPVRSGWSGRLDGFLIGLIAAGLFVLVATRAFAGSRVRTVRLLPLLLGPTALILWVAGYQYMGNEIAIWRRTGAVAIFQPWVYVCLAGTTMMAIGAVWLGIRDGLAPLRSTDPAEVVRVTAADVTRSVIWIVGGALGALGGIAAGLGVMGGYSQPMALVLLTLLGAVAGSTIAARVAGSLIRD
jgi:hypothetical protein